MLFSDAKTFVLFEHGAVAASTTVCNNKSNSNSNSNSNNSNSNNNYDYYYHHLLHKNAKSYENYCKSCQPHRAPQWSLVIPSNPQ